MFILKHILSFYFIIIQKKSNLIKYYFRLFSMDNGKHNGKVNSIFFLYSICKECNSKYCNKGHSNMLDSKCMVNSSIYSILVHILEHRCKYSNGILSNILENICHIKNWGIRGSNDMSKMTFIYLY